MKLGNSKGNNRGKKYFMRGIGNMKPVAGGLDKADRFRQWFEKAYHSLVRELRQKNIYDEDAMNDTYLKIWENLVYSNLNILEYRSYFMRSFYTNLMNTTIRAGRYCEMMPGYDAEDDDLVYDFELERRQQQLETDIFDYVYDRYSVREFELFKMYMCLKPAMNYGVLSEITSLKVHQIQFTISKIKKDLCRHKEFIARRREARA